MKKTIAVFMLTSTLMVPMASLWASAGDSTLQGQNGTTTGAPATKAVKKAHGHRHVKKSTSPTAVAPTSK